MSHLVKSVAVALGLLASPASAQDWGGLYGGLTLSMSNVTADHSFSNDAPSDTVTLTDGWPGLFLGYNIQRGNLVFGAELEYQSASGSGSYENYSNITSAGETRLKEQMSLRAIMGYSGRIGRADTLFYGALGATRGSFEFRGGPASFGGGQLVLIEQMALFHDRSRVPENGYDQTLNGISFGLGIDTRLNDAMALRAEYRQTDFGESDGSLAPMFSGVSMPVKVRQSQFTLGLRMDF